MIKDKLNLPKVINATYKVITPMFIGDAEQKASWISPMSFKGALRFWWRTLAWGKIRLNPEYNSDELAMKELHHQEALLFGSSAEIPKEYKIKYPNQFPKNRLHYGKGSVKVVVIDELLNNSDKQLAGSVHQKLKNYPASRYLGYGVIEAFASKNKNISAGQLVRDCINEGKEFKVKIILDDSTKMEEIKQALILMGLLGGLGSKVRKGYGSIKLLKLAKEALNKNETIWQSPQDLLSYQKELNKILTNANKLAEIPPFSAFSATTFITATTVGQDVYQVLEDYGRAMIFYRSWGKNNKVLNQDSEKNFQKDHDWSKGEQVFKLNFPNDDYHKFHPERTIFGLPHSYGKQCSVGRDVENKTDGRRSSPLLFHVQEIGGKYYGIATLLRAQFLPKNEKIKANKNPVEQNINWDILQAGFLADKKRFPKSQVIFPSEISND